MKTKTKKSTWRRIRYAYRKLGPYARPHRKWLALGSMGALLVVAARLAFPWPLRGAMELVLADGQPNAGVLNFVPPYGNPVWWLAGGFVMLGVTLGFAEYVQRVSFAKFAVGAVHDARAAKMKQLIKKAHRLPDSDGAGDVIARVIGDSARLKAGIKGVLVHASQNGIFVLGVGVVLVLIDPLLGSVFITGAVLALLVAFIGTSRVSRVARRYRRKEGEIAEVVHQALTSDRKKAKGRRKEALKARALNFKHDNKSSGNKDVRVTRLQAQTTWAVHGVMSLLAVAVMVIGVQGVQTGRLSAGDLFTVVAYIIQVHNRTVRLGRQTARLGKVLASAERLAAVKAPPKPKPRPELRSPGPVTAPG